ncbi:MAG: D-TA family PLP-dependent enzyme [Gemmatimonadales bacterium]|nr:D-TA family PLP-dependent enzyme [Gemmatimonadales bacterium]
MSLTAKDTPAPVAALSHLATPALLIVADRVDGNIAATLRLLGGDANRWRPHLKTSKLLWTMRRIREAGVRQAKCATTLELLTACQAGFENVLLAYPTVGPHVGVTRAIAERFPDVAVSALVESAEMVAPWRGSRVQLFIDLNSGMDRTGMAMPTAESVLGLVRAIEKTALRFAGLHFYDGHASGFPAAEVRAPVHAGYEHLLEMAVTIRDSGIDLPEIVTAGTPAFPHAADYQGFRDAGFLHRVSPGTVVYNDRKSLTQLPAGAGYQHAAFVLSSVVSLPGASRFTCDAGHKTVSADAGDPTCEVVGHERDYTPRHPSEEHLPVDLATGVPLPARGTLLFLVPTHVCPTVNNFDEAVIIENGTIAGIEKVTARGR